MNRREMLKLFGVGSAIVPLVGGVPELQAEATLIQEPRVQLADSLTSLPVSCDLLSPGLGRYSITVEARPEYGKAIRFSATAFTVSYSVDWLEVQRDPCVHTFVPMQQQCRFTIEGRCLDPGPLVTIL